jgi:hypothetical protein
MPFLTGQQQRSFELSTWVVPELGTDFTNDFEDLVIAYIFQEWEIADPPKGSTMKPNTTTENGAVSFKSGFPDFFRAYECCCVQTRTEVLEQYSGKSRFVFTTGLDVMLRMKRLNRDAASVDPQLENMEREIIRIMTHYRHNDIPGIKDLLFDPAESHMRVYNATDTYAKSDWRSIVRVKAFYEKQNLT